MRARLDRLLAIPAALALALGCGPTGAPDAPDRPDVLLVTLDTLRADHVGVYGAGTAATPHLDALAAQGAVFLRALAASSRTAPSHASIFTSRWVRDHAIGYHNGSTRLHDEATLAAILAGAGYRTAAVVSNSMLRRRIGLDRGFASYDDELPDAEANRPVFERVAEKTTARALGVLAEPRQEPLFLWVHYNDPHGPYTPPPAYVGAARGAPGEAPLPVLDIQRGIDGIPAYQAVGDERRPSQYRARYAGEIRYLDASLGELLAAFDARGGGIAIVTADHGESLGEDGVWFSHGFATTPDLAHVPFLLRAPGLAPARIDAPVHHVDVLPTLLEWLGLPVPPGIAGIALGPALRGESPWPAERDLFVDVGSEVSVYRGDRFVRARFGESLAGAESGSRDAFQWSSGVAWRSAEAPPGLVERAERHAEARAPQRPAPKLGPDDAERLRALGYLEPNAP